MSSFHRWSRAGLALISLMASCRHRGGEAVDVPDGRIDVHTDSIGDVPAGTKLTETKTIDPTTFDPRVPLDLNGAGATSIADLWQAGATMLDVREVKASADCEASVLEAAGCLDEEEWKITRSERLVTHLTCRCGVARNEKQTLSQADFQNLDTRIRGLAIANNPTPCVSDAPDVKVEVTASTGDKNSYAVNYGQCVSSFAPRIDLKSFEALIENLSQIKF